MRYSFGAIGESPCWRSAACCARAGLVAIALEPRGASNPELALENGRVIAADIEAAGFHEVRLESAAFGRVPTICAIGLKRDPE